MRSCSFILILAMFLALPLHAQDLASTCHASSTYDLTLQAHGFLFDRTAPSPTRVEVSGASLRVDGVEVRLATGERSRLTFFERDLGALVPRARAVADHGVDLATQTVLAEADRLGLTADARVELDRRVAAHASRLKQRIAASRSTRDWNGPALDQYVSDITADLLPLITADLGQQALQAALSGDTGAALSLRDGALDLATGLKSRLRERMQVLRPQIVALCPSIRQLLELQGGFTDPYGKPLKLLESDP
ncbi:MAG: DUF2884 family protein [Rhodanobacter sp.]